MNTDAVKAVVSILEEHNFRIWADDKRRHKEDFVDFCDLSERLAGYLGPYHELSINNTNQYTVFFHDLTEKVIY